VASPIRQLSGELVSSAACRSCHPGEHASWHRTYHRTMTQSATLAHVAAPALRGGGRLHTETSGRTVELFGRGAELWARLPDPTLLPDSAAAHDAVFRSAPDVERQIVLLTGSHQQQAFWVRGRRAGELLAVPAVYLIADERLVPRRDAFVSPPGAPEQSVRWNSNCIQCHATGGQPQHDAAQDRFDSAAGELGIACEACHGGGAEHVRRMQNPALRYAAHFGLERELSIVNPASLSAPRASEVCGRCHSYFFPKHEQQWWTSGFSSSFAPGDELSRSQLLLAPETFGTPGAPAIDAHGESLFYADGTIRVGGREYNGLVRSPCFERGRGKRQLSCLSCHSMHESEPQDQLAEGMRGNEACTGCHAEKAGQGLARHTHHAATSPGSLCYNCHMPHTSYALLGAIRSHRIDSPSFGELTRDRPNACSLCHLEQSVGWAAERAASFYGAGPRYAPFREAAELPELPAGAFFALRGDAGARAIVAAALGRDEGPERSAGLRAQLLAELARDDYAAVRSIAEKSLRRLRLPQAPPEIAPEIWRALRAERDERPLTIAE
jgi:predicted CXXCH cytochrome family protein